MDFFESGWNTVTNGLKLNIVTALRAKGDDWEGENIVSPFSRIYYVKSGSGRLVCGENEYILTPGFVYLIPVGTRISFHSCGQLEKVYAHFNILRPDGYDLLRDFKGVGVIERNQAHIEKIFALFESPYMSDKFIFDSMLQSDIADMIGKYGIIKRKSVNVSPVIQKVIDIILEKPNIKITVASLSQAINVSESFLSKKFRKETGLSVNEYLSQMVFYNAQIELATSDKSIDEIAEKYGFCDRFYFSRRFKKVFFTTPAHYRKSMKTSSK